MSDWTSDYARGRWKTLTDRTWSPMPEVKAQASEARTCFAISWYTDEADAKKVADYVNLKGFTYNGGWYHGMECGREARFDFIGADGKLYYAVTH